MFALGFAIYAAMYIAARFVPFIIPTGFVSALAITSLSVLSWSLMAASIVEAAARYLP